MARSPASVRQYQSNNQGCFMMKATTALRTGSGLVLRIVGVNCCRWWTRLKPASPTQLQPEVKVATRYIWQQ